MAIQSINDSLPNGDSPRKINTKINQNFSNSEHAASKLVGTRIGQVPTAGMLGMESNKTAGSYRFHTIDDKPSRFFSFYQPPNQFSDEDPDWEDPTHQSPHSQSGTHIGMGLTIAYRTTVQPHYTEIVMPTSHQKMYFRVNGPTKLANWNEVYHTGNTQSDTSTNGYIKPSSPIIMLHTDSITTNDDGEKMGVEFTKKGVGDYEIKGTTGLRNEGWYIEIPNDLHGNPMVAVTLDENDGTLNLKSFKRVFNMQTFKFEPDLYSPMDIPEGRWIDLRFNDLLEEELHEPELVDEEEESEVTEEEPVEEEPKG